MHHKQFTLLLGIVVALFGIGLSLGQSRLPSLAADLSYYNQAAQAVIAKCGSNAQLVEILIRQNVTRYAFTPGTCSSASVNDFVEVEYDFKSHSLGSPWVGDASQKAGFYDFPHDLTQPIPIQSWKVSSGDALRIISRQKETQNITDVSLLSNYASIQLYLLNGSLVWDYSGSGYLVSDKVLINATTGQVISSKNIPILTG